jgi:hypothetical protein
MRVMIETTGELVELPNGGRGELWKGSTQDGTPVVAVLVSIGCSPEHKAAFARAMHPHEGADAALRDPRRKEPRRCSWQDRLFGTPPLACGTRSSATRKGRRPAH